MSPGAIVWEKQAFLDLCGIQIHKVAYMSFLRKVFESLANKIQFSRKDSKISGVSGLLF